MSAAEDLQVLYNDFLPTRAIDVSARGACRAPRVPTAQGVRHEGVSCLRGVPSRGPVAAANEPPRAPLPPRCPEVDATDPDGRRYEGNLLFDVLVYRSLRARQMAGLALNCEDETMLTELESSLRPTEAQQSAPVRRNFLRFDTSDIDGIALARYGEPVVTMSGTLDLGGGGICVRTNLSLEAGESVSVHVSGQGEDHHRTVVLPARVAWVRGSKVGLMFAGGPSWN